MHSNTIHGSFFYLLRDFIESLKPGAWADVIKEAGISQKNYNPHESYPMEEFSALLNAAALINNMSLTNLEEKFGESLVPALLKMYGKHLDPQWKTFEVLLYTEIVMHKAVRKQENKAAPPMLNVSRVHDKLLIIDYYSVRKLGCLAVGIIRGIAAHFGESDSVKVIPTTSPFEERVQIRIEFL